jgi:hypothetical protein
MYLAFITHDVKSNTLEAQWLQEVVNSDGEIVSLKSAKRRNYSKEQKAEFEADCGAGSSKYTQMAGW